MCWSDAFLNISLLKKYWEIWDLLILFLLQAIWDYRGTKPYKMEVLVSYSVGEKSSW